MQTNMLTRIATIDLGSNSFHMLIVEVNERQKFRVLTRQKQKVQLRAGVTEAGFLDHSAQERAFKCFERFAKQIRLHEVAHVDVVGTYTLRMAKEIDDFLAKAHDILGHPIRVISGEEEARLIYVGASTGRHLEDKHLIIDIGGGSTELIIGENSQILALASTDMGCVSFQQRFFSDGLITEQGFKSAIEAAKSLLAPIREQFINESWSRCLGTSGTVQAIHSILKVRNETITLENLHQIRLQLLELGQVDQIRFEGLRSDRENILAGGLSVLIGIFESFSIDSMQLSKGAVREGVLHELIARLG